MYSNKAHRDKNKKWAIELLGDKCVVCGSAQDLEFDHIHPSTKVFAIGGALQRKRSILEAELSKCQLLCSPCHWNKTRADRGLSSLEHGTVNMYMNGKCRCNLCGDAWTKYFSPKLHIYRSSVIS